MLSQGVKQMAFDIETEKRNLNRYVSWKMYLYKEAF